MSGDTIAFGDYRIVLWEELLASCDAARSLELKHRRALDTE